MLRSKVIGLGAYVPPKVVTNDDLTKMMETSDEWIRQRTGIEERRWVETGVNNSDLALIASQDAIKDAGLEVGDIDMIIYATLSPDHDFPGTGCFLQEKLNISSIPCLDIRQQCTGFIYGMAIADSFIRTGTVKNVLVVGSEVHSTGFDKSTRGRDVAVLFGDGAGAAIIQATEVNNPSEDPHIYSNHLFTEGKFAKELWVPAPGAAMAKAGDVHERLTTTHLEQGLHYPMMNGKKVFQHAVKNMIGAIDICLKQNHMQLNDIDLFAFHQANLRINEMIADKIKIPNEKIFNTIQKYGNTTAATIPLGLVEARKSGVLQKGMRVMCVAFGSGFTWASNLFRY